ncbi:MAG: DUF6751 family protein [Clostridia bacterium]|jgi:hypothetical protein|nr:DUF6751 family protein [Clostridia bacterium]DAQ69755.1 MAG TPA: hypothetical protein [Caudoviricetes sp.]
MNDRFFIHQITVYHTTDDENFTIETFDKVYFRHNKKTNLVDKGLEKGSTGSITIPTTDKLDISTNDYVVEGIVEDKFDLSALQKKYQVFKVVSVDDNRKGSLQHYKIGVSE